MRRVGKRTANTRDLSDTYEFPICLQVLQGSAGNDLAPYLLGCLNILGVDVLPEHNRWQCDPSRQIGEREHLLCTRTISQALRKRLVWDQNTDDHRAVHEFNPLSRDKGRGKTDVCMAQECSNIS